MLLCLRSAGCGQGARHWLWGLQAGSLLRSLKRADWLARCQPAILLGTCLVPSPLLSALLWAATPGYLIPALLLTAPAPTHARRGLLGVRNALLTATKGMAVMHTNFAEYGPWCGDLAMRDNGSLLSFDTGPSTSYALDSIQARGKLFIGPGEEIYKGQVCLPVHCAPSLRWVAGQ